MLQELIGKLAFFAMALWLVVALVSAAAAMLAGRGGVARRWMLVTGVGLGLYAAALLGVSLTSRGRVLPRGAELPVCALDCDLFLSVAAAQPVTEAPGVVLWRVQLRARSDAKRVTMTLDDVRVELADARGRVWAPTGGARAGSVFNQPLAPGASEVAECAFRVPTGASAPRLRLARGPWFTRFVLADEGSFFHRRTELALDPADPAEKGL